MYIIPYMISGVCFIRRSTLFSAYSTVMNIILESSHTSIVFLRSLSAVTVRLPSE